MGMPCSLQPFSPGRGRDLCPSRFSSLSLGPSLSSGLTTCTICNHPHPFGCARIALPQRGGNICVGISENLLRCLELDTWALRSGIQEEVLVVSGPLEGVGTQGVADHMVLVEGLELVQVLGDCGRLAVGARP